MFVLAYAGNGGFILNIEDMDTRDRRWFVERLGQQKTKEAEEIKKKQAEAEAGKRR